MVISPNNLDYFLNSYPKQRPPISEEIKQIYASHYEENREGKTKASSLAQRLESWMHHQINDVMHDNARVLELGAGTINHLKFPKAYNTYDIIEPFTALYEKSAFKDKVDGVYSDVGEIDGQRYDYVFSVAVLEHLTQLPEDIAKAALLLENDGKFVASIPSEGGFLWGLAWRMSTGLEFYLRHRLNYGDLMRHEHINSCQEIQSILALVFEKVTIRRFGLGNHLSLYQCIVCEKPRHDVCHQILGSNN